MTARAYFRRFFPLLALVLSAACSRPQPPLEVYGTVPAFSMTDSHGASFQSRSLAGKVWVADFIYTNCPAECPLMSSRMHRLEKELHGESDVRLVSISVDPARDTPAALTGFANRYGGANRQWLFLTGTPDTVHQIAYTTFHVGDVLGRISHSTKFVLVDGKGQIRGYYSSLDEESLTDLRRDLERLRTEGA